MVKVAISSNYSHIKLPYNLKQSIESMKRNNKASTPVIYRTLISGMLLMIDDKALGNCNAEILHTKYSDIIHACKGKFEIIGTANINKKTFIKTISFYIVY